MKFDITPAPALVSLGASWRARMAGRAVVVAASTREGEERALLKAWRAELTQRHELRTPILRTPLPQTPLLLIVPRHPQRFDEVCALAVAEGLRVRRRSKVFANNDEHSVQLAQADAQADVLIGDSMGEMFAYYELADVAILGGSLLPYGGQNLIESCAVGTPVIFGPHTFNFDEAAEQAIDRAAAVRVADADAAVAMALLLIADAPRLAQMSQSALVFAAAHRGATEKTLAAIAPLLAALHHRPPAA
jgi:3-deoxy-D-manno-octulosonic-acid transferase